MVYSIVWRTMYDIRWTLNKGEMENIYILLTWLWTIEVKSKNNVKLAGKGNF